MFPVILTSCGDNNQVSPEEPIEAAFPCTDGVADERYPCSGIDLLAHVTSQQLKGEQLNDIWGWTDPESGKEYALVGLIDGVTFVDISDPGEPQVVGKLMETQPTGSAAAKAPAALSGYDLKHGKSDWRDFKVYRDHLFVVSDNQERNIHHGMQVFDLTRLREMSPPAEEYSEDALYTGIRDAHNVAINEETGYAYIVGSKSDGPGLHIVDISSPLQPEFAGYHADTTVGGYSGSGYVHDTQCVVYQGPDDDYRGDEICFNSAESHLEIVDVSQKDAITQVSKSTYDGNRYAHQGWLTEDHRYFLLDDELDEWQDNINTSTYIWDVSDLDAPELIGTYTAEVQSIDHNQYVKGNRVYQANYTSGLRVLSLDGISSGLLDEAAYFDTYPENNQPDFNGAWSNYPYFESGVIAVSDISEGLFLLKLNNE